MKLLIDTCVLSELHRPNCDPRVPSQFENIADSDLFLSTITLSEIVHGISRLAPGKKRQDLSTWLNQIEQLHAPRILPIDTETARIWGEITARASQQGITLPADDGLIASTALRHGLHLMTRNVPHFQPTGVLLLDPWQQM